MSDTLRDEVEQLLDTHEWPGDGELFQHAVAVAVEKVREAVRKWGHVVNCECAEEMVAGKANEWLHYTDPRCAPPEEKP